MASAQEESRLELREAVIVHPNPPSNLELNSSEPVTVPVPVPVPVPVSVSVSLSVAGPDPDPQTTRTATAETNSNSESNESCQLEQVSGTSEETSKSKSMLTSTNSSNTSESKNPSSNPSPDDPVTLTIAPETPNSNTLINTANSNTVSTPIATTTTTTTAAATTTTTAATTTTLVTRRGSGESCSETSVEIIRRGSQDFPAVTATAAALSLSLSLSLCPPEQINQIHFLVGNKSEIALVPTNSSSDDIKDLFRSAAEAGPCDIVKLYTLEGRLINISPRIPPNSSSSPYRLEVVAVHCNGILMEQVGIDLLSLEKRYEKIRERYKVSALERILKNQGSPCDSIQELKEEVYQLRNKLENYEHLSWLGFYKALHPPPLPTPPRTPGVGYHKKSRGDKQIICDKFLMLCDVILTRETCQLLREPTFDNWQWEDEEMLVLMQQMYLDLELPRKFDIEISILRNFLVNVYHHYNDVPFHNFRHCFCVTQMMFGMASYVNLAERVGDLEVLILLTSCICHDLDHPGYNNIYQINAQTELALRYNDISPLENHHCSIAFRILEDPECNIFRNLPTGTYRKIREGIIRCILATDMARHNEIVNQFREIVPYFDSTNKAHINLLSMVLIKVADISNEARPMDVAEPWLDCLLAEFFQQSDTEKLEGLPVTPFMDRDKITKPSSQCSFIGLVLLPLFEALGSFFAELDPLIIQPVRDALEYYRRLNEAAQASRHRKSTDAGPPAPPVAVSTGRNGNGPPAVPDEAPPPPNASLPPGGDAPISSGPTTTTNTTAEPGDSSSKKSPTTTNTSAPSTISSPHSSSWSKGINPSPSEQQQQQPQPHSTLRDKLPSDPCSVNRFARSSSDSNSMQNPKSVFVSSHSQESNPIANAHRRASQLLVRVPGSGGSGSVTSLRSSMTTRSGPGHFTSFPSLESDSEREGGDSEEDDDAITEVAVSEKALKFKIATESSFDFSGSRKSSRENKSESSVQSGSNSIYSHHSHNHGSHAHQNPTSKDAMFSPHSSASGSSAGGNISIASLAATGLIMSDTAHANAATAAGLSSIVSHIAVGRAGSSTSVGVGVLPAPGPVSTTPTNGNPSTPSTSASASGSSTTLLSSTTKAKAKDSFFTRLKLFTERLSSADSASTSEGGSGGGSPASARKSQGGFGYFRRSGRSKSSNERYRNTVSMSTSSKDDRASTSTSIFGRRVHHHHVSNSDTEGNKDDVLRRHHTIHTVTAQHITQVDGEGEKEGRRELASSDCDYSPALSRASGEPGTGLELGLELGENRSEESSWKECSGSLDSILSKDDAKQSPSRKLTLPKFSSFVHKKTRLGFMKRLSSSPNKGTTSSGSADQQAQPQQPPLQQEEQPSPNKS